MITFSQLGNFGSKGNQLFQIASTIGIAFKNNQQFVFPEWKYNKYYAKPLPRLNKSEPLNYEYYNGEEHFHYQDIILDPNKNYDLGGYFQSPLYFENHKEIINEYFTLKLSYTNYLDDKYGNLFAEKTTSLHVRRGDYLNFPTHHPVLPVEYYQQATEYFPDHLLLVFSDDIEWCKTNLNHLSTNMIFVEGENEVLDLHLMSMCQNNIIANSSFSWWAAYFNHNPTKIVIAPNNWFGPALSHLNTKDLLPINWIKI